MKSHELCWIVDLTRWRQEQRGFGVRLEPEREWSEPAKPARRVVALLSSIDRRLKEINCALDSSIDSN